MEPDVHPGVCEAAGDCIALTIFVGQAVQLDVTVLHREPKEDDGGFVADHASSSPHRRNPSRHKGQRIVRSPISASEVDEAPLDIGMHEIHPCPITDIQALESVHQLSFHGRLHDTDPCAFL